MSGWIRSKTWFLLLLNLLYLVKCTKFQDEVVSLHNEFRKIHKSPDVKLDASLTKKAQKEADDAAQKGNLIQKNTGTNSYMMCASYDRAVQPKDAVEAWYDEVCNPKFSFEKSNVKEAHAFTQLIWKDTEYIGVGKSTKPSKDGGSCHYVVVAYRPPGNLEIVGADTNKDSEYLKNVKKGNFNSSYCEKLKNDKRSMKEPKKIEKRSLYMSSASSSKEKAEPEQSISIMLAKALKVHNSLRAIHGSGKLKMVQELNDEAEKQAQLNANIDKLQHADFQELMKKDQGENLAFNCKQGGISNIEDSIKDWYEEACTENYNFNSEKNHGTLHFSQVVWDGTTEIGCGRAVSVNRKILNNELTCTFFACRYRKRGNTMGTFVENVKKGTFNKEITCNNLKNEVEQAAIAAEANENEENDNNAANGGANATATQPPGNNPPQNAADKPDQNQGNAMTSTEPTVSPTTSSNLMVTTPRTFPTQPPTATPPSGSEEPLDKGQTAEENQQDQDEKNYEDDATRVMNKFREIHGVPLLLENENLHKKAKERADNFVGGAAKRMHKRSQVGENVQVACNPIEKVVPPEEAVTNWYREVCTKNYNFALEGSQNASHFTQIVWKHTASVGVAYATKKKKNGFLCTVIVAEFEATGNTVGAFRQNVQKGRFDKSFCGSLFTIATAALDDTATPKGGSEPEGNAFKKPSSDNPNESPLPIDGSEKKPAQKPLEPVESKNPLEKPSFSNTPESANKPKEEEAKNPLETPEEAKSPLSLPEEETKKPLDQPEIGKNPLEEPLNEGKNPLEQAPNPQEQPKEGKNPLEQPPEQEGANPMEKPKSSNTPSENPLGVENPSEEGKNPLDKPNDNAPEKQSDDKFPLQQTGEKNPLAKPTTEKNPSLEGKNPLEQPNDNAPGKQPDEKNPLQQAEGEKKPLAKPATEKNPLQEGKNPLEQPQEGKNPLEPPQGGAKPQELPNNVPNTPLGKQPEDQTPLKKPNEKPLEKPQEGKNPLDQPEEGKNPLEQPMGEKNAAGGKPGDENPLNKPEDAKKPPKIPQEAKNPFGKPSEEPSEEAKNPLEKLEEGKNPLENPQPQETPSNKPEDNNSPSTPGEADQSQSKPLGNTTAPGSPNGAEVPKKPTGIPEKVSGTEEGEGPSSPAPAMSTSLKNGLAAHNALRGIHGSKRMKPNEDLEAKSREIAASIADAGGKMENKKRQDIADFGENVNVNCDTSSKTVEEEATLKWWSQDFCDTGPSTISDKRMGAGTQVIWDATDEIGMATSAFMKDGKLCYVVVALYTPKGNDRKTYDQNVFQGDFDFETMCDDKNNTLQTAKELDKDKNQEATEPQTPSSSESTPAGSEPNQTTGGGAAQKPGGGAVQKPGGGAAQKPGGGAGQKPGGGADQKPGGEGSGKPGGGEEKKPEKGQPEAAGGKGLDQKKFAQEGLEAHNKLRKIHGSPPMALDDQMNKEASEYAAKIAKLGELKHSTSAERNDDGENLAYVCGSLANGYKGEQPTASWYNEVCEYNYPFSNEVVGSTLHFTQVVWKQSVKLGMGYAKGTKYGMTCYYAVGRYRIAGNMMGNFQENVQKGSFSKATTCSEFWKMLNVTPDKRSKVRTHVGHALMNKSKKHKTPGSTANIQTMKGTLKKKGYIQQKRAKSKKA